MTKKGSTSGSGGLESWFRPPRLKLTIRMLMIAGMLILLVIFLTTGSDPFGLFSLPEETPTTAAILVPQETPTTAAISTRCGVPTGTHGCSPWRWCGGPSACAC